MVYIPKVSPELAERTKSFNEDILRSVEPDDSYTIEYRRRLQAIHPRLTMVKARERVVPGVPMKPGYYHVLVYAETAPWSVAVVEGEHGEFVEPTSRVIENVLAGDMTERRNLERFAQLAEEERRRNARELADSRAERKEDLKDRVDAYTRTSVSLTDARPWTQNTQPNARRAKGQTNRKRRK